MKLTIATYTLSADANGIITWNAPDGNAYTLNPQGALAGQWKYTKDANGNKKIAYMPKPPTTPGGYGTTPDILHPYPEEKPSGDGVLVISLAGAPGWAATLLHYEDDIADRQYYFASDTSNHPLVKDANIEHPAFILRAKGIAESPLKPYSGFQVLVIA